MNGLDQQWKEYLVDLSSLSPRIRGYKDVVTRFDVSCQYEWLVLLKVKIGKTLVAAFEKIFREGRAPERSQTDAGTKFN